MRFPAGQYVTYARGDGTSHPNAHLIARCNGWTRLQLATGLPVPRPSCARAPPPRCRGGESGDRRRNPKRAAVTHGTVGGTTGSLYQVVSPAAPTIGPRMVPRRRPRRGFHPSATRIVVHSPENRGRFLESAKLLDKRGGKGFRVNFLGTGEGRDTPSGL